MIIPVKALTRAKTRLGSAEPANAALALAFFQDALSAVQSTAAVRSTVVATSDPVVAAWAAERGAVMVDDSSADGINAAAAHAARMVAVDGPVAVVVSDLPCLTAPAVDAVLSLARHHRSSFVRDAAGSGTTMWMSTDGAIDSRFGPESAAAHLGAGATDLIAAAEPAILALARRDVDTSDDLAAARTLGVGRYTAAASGSRTIVTVAEECLVDRVDIVPAVDEDGQWHDVPGEVLTAAGFRLVRVGQRLAVDRGPDGKTVRAQLP